MNLDIKQLTEKAELIIAERDTGEASIFLRELSREAFSSLPTGLVLNLELIALPSLPDEEAAHIFKTAFLKSLDFDISLYGQIIAKLFSIPYLARDELRIFLKKSLEENQETLGNQTISQWIHEYEKEYILKRQGTSNLIDFIRSSRNAQNLSVIDKEKLKEILHIYDSILSATLPATYPILNKILDSPDFENIPEKLFGYNRQKSDQNQSRGFTGKNIGQSYTEKGSATSSTQLKFNDALKKYSDLGEQLITSNRIKLKSFPEPVRPSIKNWISDYTFNAGYEKHDAMAIGNYLYQNENAQKLNAYDRQRLAYILKAYDENAEVTVNEKTKQIIFPSVPRSAEPQKAAAFPQGERAAHNISSETTVDLRQNNPEPRDIFNYRPNNFVASGPKPELESKTMPFKSEGLNRPENPQIQNTRYLSAGQTGKMPNTNLTFSSPHKLPFESKNNEQRPAINTQKIPGISNQTVPNSRTSFKPFSQSSQFNNNFTHKPAGISPPKPFGGRSDNPAMTQPIIPKPESTQPVQAAVQKPDVLQPMIISPRRRFKKPIPDYNVVNLKDKQ